MHENKRDKNCISRGKGLRRAVSAILILLTVVLMLPLTVLADGYGKTVENTYIINIGTGRVAGDCIRFLSIKYKDIDNNVRTEFVFNKTSDYNFALNKAREIDYQKNTRAVYNNNTGETVPNNGKDFLTSDSANDYIFCPRYNVSELISIDVYMNYTEGTGQKNEWTCTDIRVFKVDKLYGLMMYGYCSGNNYVEFDGTYLAELAPSNDAYDLVCDGMDKLYRFGFGRKYDDVGGQQYYLEKKNQAYSNRSAKKLLRLDISDVYGGGIEALSTPVSTNGTQFDKMKFREALALQIKYKDIFGKPRVINIPVVTSFCSWVMEQEPDIREKQVIGIMQQGDTVLFRAALPDFSELTGYVLYYNDQAESLCGINPSATAEAEMSQLQSCPTSPNTPDTLSIAGMSIFGGDTKYSISLDGGILRCATTGTPEYYYTANTFNGFSLVYGSNKLDMAGEMRKGKEGVALRPEGTRWTYVVEIETDSVSSSDAATTENISAKFHYLSKSGREKSGDNIKLRTAASEFTGYWAGIQYDGGDKSSIPDTAYRLGTACDGKIIFGLDYTDVDYFTGVTLSMDPDVQDEWQMKGIKIYRVSYVSGRQAQWTQIGFTEADRSLHNGVMTDRYLFRDYDKSVCVRSYNKTKVLLYHKENSKKINFDSEGGGSTENNYVNWNEIKESMDYETTLQDLGFSKGMCEYEVRVKVKSNAGINGDDDSGSKNKFYFKLVFDEGSSAYVLANQQLLADGFRAGQTESFKITTNRDYGNLSAVYIIPDDIQEDSAPMDKLNIESLTVINTSDSGVSRTWMCKCAEGGEWVAVKNIQDAGAQGSAGGQQGRSEMGLANVMTVDSAGYSLKFLFTIKTTGYTEGYKPFDGSLMGKITYRDAQGRQQQMNVDIIRAMYDYMGKEPQWTNDLAPDNSGDFLARANPALMLRANHVDRFFVSIPDVNQIIGLEFFGSYSKGNGSVPTEAKITEWLIGSVEVHIVKESGQLELNKFNEYKRTDTTEYLCGSINPQGYRLQISSSSEVNNLPLIFDTGTIDISESGTWNANTHKEPANNNDTLNLYVYMADTADKKADYTMNASVVYLKRDDDKTYQTYVKNMTRSKDGKMFTKMGLSAKSLSTIYKLSLKANSFSNPYATVDKVIVQHVRSGVVINNYVFDFNGRDVCFSELEREPDNSSAKEAASVKQIVTLQLSDDTTAATLSRDVEDVNVAIRYTTTNDSGKETYNSRNISLNAAGISKIEPNDVVRVEFNEPYVKEITGIHLQAVGDIKTSVDCACVETLTSDSSNNVSRTGWYNFGGSDGALSFSTKTLTRSNTTVVPIKFSFIVANASNSTMPVRMEMKVLNRFNEERTDTYEDINKFITSGSFMAGETVTTEMLLRDVSTVRSITLSPHDDTAEVMSLELASVLAKWTIDGTDASASRNVNVTINEGTKQAINLSNITVEYSAVSYDESGNSYGETNSHTDGTASAITIKSGHYVIIKPKVVGSLPGYGYKTECVLADGDMSKKTDYCAVKDGSVIFQPPENNTAEDLKYRITFSSEEAPASANAVLIVTVKPAPQKEPEPPVSGTDPI